MGISTSPYDGMRAKMPRFPRKSGLGGRADPPEDRVTRTVGGEHIDSGETA